MSDGRAPTLRARAALPSRQTAERVRRWWASATPRFRAVGLVVGLAGAVLLGAFLFGAWHVIFGWLVRGNPRAGLFGLALSTVTGLLLIMEGILVRRHRLV